MSPVRKTNEPGFAEIEALLASKNSASGQTRSPHNVAILLDTSLSMQWDKLERSYEALEKILHSLTPQDHFNVMLFNSKVSTFQPAWSGVTPVSLNQATEYVRGSRLRGGTDLHPPLDAALSHCAPPPPGNSVFCLPNR